MEQLTSRRNEVNLTTFRKNMKQYLDEARREGSVTITQGSQKFHVVATKNCTEKKIGFLYY